MTASTPQRAWLTLALFAITGCPDLSVDKTEADGSVDDGDEGGTLIDETTGATDPAEDGESLIALEATGYFVCGIDAHGSLDCTLKDGGAPMNLTDLEDFQYVDLSANQLSVCAVRDNDGAGTGDIHCFTSNIGYGHGFYDVYEGNFSAVTNRNGVCGLEDGEIVCFESPSDAGYESFASGPFTDIWDYGTGHADGVFSVRADGSLALRGNGYFEDQQEVCPLPTTGVLDVDVGPGPIVHRQAQVVVHCNRPTRARWWRTATHRPRAYKSSLEEVAKVAVSD